MNPQQGLSILYNAVGYKPAYNLGGPVSVLEALAEGLARRGHKVYVSATNSNLTETLPIDTNLWHEINGVYVRYFPVKPLWIQKIPLPSFQKSNANYYTPDFKQWLFTQPGKFDIIHSQLPFLYSNLVASEYAEKNNIPYFYSQHGVLDPLRLQYRRWKKQVYYHFYERKALQRAAVLLASTPQERLAYQALGWNQRIEIIPNGVHLPEDKERTWPLPEWKPPPEAPLVLFMGRWHPLKGVDLALKAFYLARKTAPDSYLLLAGPDEYGLLPSLQRQIQEFSLDDRVFCCGAVYGEVRDALYERADVFLLPTVSEGNSIALLEAMAHRCAILTTPGAHMPEIHTRQAGIICERDPEALGQALAHLLANRSLTRAMGEQGRRLVQEHYTWEKIVPRYEDLYYEVQMQAQDHAKTLTHHEKPLLSKENLTVP